MRLRFTIRDLLWLAALVAVCVAWWLQAQKHKADIRQLETSIEVLEEHLTPFEYMISVSKLGFNDPGAQKLYSQFKAELSELRKKVAEFKD
jgi:hypothetical protein